MTSTTSLPTEGSLRDALLDSWRRNNVILVNLPRALPEDAMDLSAVDGSPTVGELFRPMHYCRLVFVRDVAPELGVGVPGARIPNAAPAAEALDVVDVQSVSPAGRSLRVR